MLRAVFALALSEVEGKQSHPHSMLKVEGLNVEGSLRRRSGQFLRSRSGQAQTTADDMNTGIEIAAVEEHRFAMTAERICVPIPSNPYRSERI